MKELGSEFAGGGKDSRQTEPKTQNPIVRTRRPVVTEQTSCSSAQEIDTRFSLDCENTNSFVERLEKDKDADENVDADQTRTVRLVSGSRKLPCSRTREEDRESSSSTSTSKPICNKITPTTHPVTNRKQ